MLVVQQKGLSGESIKENLAYKDSGISYVSHAHTIWQIVELLNVAAIVKSIHITL